MDDSTLFRRQHQGLKNFYRALAAGAPASRLLQRAGVRAAIVPEVPERSFMNAVVYDDPDGLAATLDFLARAYDEAGVNAWTVWVPERDERTARLLEQAGHHLDATPTAMGMELAGWEPPEPRGGAVIEDEADIADLALINEVAYGYAEGEFRRGLTLHPAGLRSYAARLDGRVVACSASLDDDGDCCLTFVASLPEARGLGLATDLMIHMMRAARERGCETASLQATKIGRPIYDRLGFRNLGTLQMWERRIVPGGDRRETL